MGIGKNMTRVDAFDKVTGSARYTADLEPQGLLVAKVIRSTIANGVVKSFDLEEARKVPGVVKIVTCFDVPDIQFPTPGHPWSVETAHQDIADRKLLNTRVRVYGDDIAAVIAEDDIAAARAARLVKVEYEEYAPLLTVEDAMAEGASRLHDEKPGNVIAHSSFVVGEGTYGEAVKEEGLVEIEKDYRTQSVQHCHIETPISFAYMEKGRIIVTTSTQIPHIVRRVISQALGIPAGEIRVIKPYIGGGFGVGIHNTLEAATFGLPLAFGPNYEKFQEARDLIGVGGARSISDYAQLADWFGILRGDAAEYQRSSSACAEYVRSHKGATGQIIAGIRV